MLNLQERPSFSGYDRSGTSIYYAAERPSPTDTKLTIPPLKRGNVNDVRLATNTFAARKEDGEYLRGLESYVRTEIGQNKTPAYFFDTHNHALFAWFEAFKEGRIKMGSTLIHIDSHGDEGIPSQPVSFDYQNLAAVSQAIPEIKIYEFIAPALSLGLIKEVIWIDPVKDATAQFSLDSEKTIKYTMMGIDSLELRKLLATKPPDQIIMDIDIDYFEHFSRDVDPFILECRQNYDSLSAVKDNDVKKIRSMLPKAGLITVATSPGFIDQTLAIELIQQIFVNE